MEIAEVKKYLEELNQDYVTFDSHFYKRTGGRPASEGMIRSFLSQINKLEKIEHGRGERFKLWFNEQKIFTIL